MSRTSQRIAAIRERLKNATPGPWGPYVSNLPFYAIVTKPAPSQSKHDENNPTYWRMEDAVLVANAPADLAYLIEQNAKLDQHLHAVCKHRDQLVRDNHIMEAALRFIAGGCLVPPDGGSPCFDDAIDAAREALAELEGK